VALSDDLASELRDLGVVPARIHEIPNGFDAAMFHPVEPAERARLRHELHLPPARTSFLFVGRLHPVKRVDTVIDALGLVPDGALVIVGDGTERAALERRAAVGGVSDRVMFVGSSDRVHEYMQAADALVLPSVAEGMSNALIEAMACALPCAVTSAISGVDELVAPDRGVLVRPGDVAAWAAVMRELAGDPSRRRSLGEAAARYVHARFTLDRTADRLATLYRELARA
jgi:glycosyltransferase involved in cell wall biosynthesis